MNVNVELDRIYTAPCEAVMACIGTESVDMIFCDLPYGTTRNKWDVMIDPEELWRAYERIIKPNGAILLFGQDKFTARMMLSNEKMHRYNIIWEKTTPTGFLNAKKMPLRTHEDIMVFYKSAPTYNPQMTSGHARKVSKEEHHVGASKTGNYGDYKFKGYPFASDKTSQTTTETNNAPPQENSIDRVSNPEENPSHKPITINIAGNIPRAAVPKEKRCVSTLRMPETAISR